MEPDVEKVFKAIVVHGLRMDPSMIQGRIREEQKRVVQVMLRDHDAGTLATAARFGMPNVWPFTEGRAFDAHDLRDNLLKAIAEAASRRRSGEIPLRLRTGGGE